MKFKPLSSSQRVGWYWISLLAGTWLIPVAIQYPDVAEALLALNPIAVTLFIALWVGQILAVRIYIQDVDTKDFWSIVGLRRWIEKSKRMY
jgi:hypothetical protein